MMSSAIPLPTKTSRRSIIAWSLAAAAILLSVILIALNIRFGTIRNPYDFIRESRFAFLILILFGIIRDLIVSKQDGNRAGWLMLQRDGLTVQPVRTSLWLSGSPTGGAA